MKKTRKAKSTFAKQVAKVILGVVLIVAVLILLAVSYIVFFMDPNQLKPMMTAQVRQYTGYELNIVGKLSWSFYPHWGIRADQITLRQPQQVNTAPFLHAEKVTIALKPWSLLRKNKQLTGSISMAHLHLWNLDTQDVYTDIRLRHGVLTFNPLRMNLYSGQLTGDAQGRNLSVNPQWDSHVKISHVQIKPLLRDVRSKTASLNIAGDASIELTLSTAGKSREELLQHLNGSSKFILAQGVLEGIDLNYYSKTAEALIHKEALSAPPVNKQTPFGTLTGDAVITQGVVHNNHFLLDASGLTASGEGNIQLLAQTLDYQVLITPKKLNKVPLIVPLLVSGNWQDPSISLDMLAISNVIADRELGDVKKKLHDEVKEHVHGKVGEALEKFLQ